MDVPHADRMRQAFLLGAKNHKRTLYLKKAADSCGLSLAFSDWDEFLHFSDLPEEDLFIKADPPVFYTSVLSEMKEQVEQYRRNLKSLEREEERRRAMGFQTRWLNTPQGILTALDKRACQELLKKAEIPTTGEGLSDIPKEGFLKGEELLSWMEDHGENQIFLKPVLGSGAAGVCAVRLQPRMGKAVLYTCGAFVKKTMENPYLVNTKKIWALREREEISEFLDQILPLDCMIERWYPKASYQGFSYDLRAVWQFGHLDFLLARLSKGPFTNLHLNNHPMNAENLGLPFPVREEIEEICQRVSSAIPGLSSFGADILLEGRKMRPRIIEINGQGDLLYQDIYKENRIYKSQAERMLAWVKKCKE